MRITVWTQHLCLVCGCVANKLEKNCYKKTIGEKVDKVVSIFARSM